MGRLAANAMSEWLVERTLSQSEPAGIRSESRASAFLVAGLRCDVPLFVKVDIVQSLIQAKINTRLSDDVLDDVAVILIQTLVTWDFQAAWVDAHQVIDCGVNVGHIVRIFDGMQT